MKSYPTGVIQNLTAGGIGAPDYNPVDKDNWSWFSDQADADTAFGWAQDPALGLFKPTLVMATTGMYSQYVYVNPTSGFA